MSTKTFDQTIAGYNLQIFHKQKSFNFFHATI